MNHPKAPVITFRVVVLVVAILAALPLVTPWQSVFSRAAGYLAITVFPGLAVYMLLARQRRLLECVLTSVVVSPVLVAAAGALVMFLGLGAGATARLLALFSAAATASVGLLAGRGSWEGSPGSRQLWGLGALIAVFCLLAGHLPLGNEWWRYWSDAWFHGGVVQQIDTYGVPPQDPYFVGMDLQYMWIYHVLVLMVSRGADIAPLVVMPLLNLNALAGFILSGYLLSTLFRKRFAYGFFAALFVLLAMNAVVWVFLPLKLVKALLGDVRGWAEVVRTYSITSFDKDTVWTFLRFYNNQPFLLNKFIVSTALSLALCFMGAFWYACQAYLFTGRAHLLLLSLASAIGMISFHTEFGVIMTGGLLGSLAVLFLTRRNLTDFSKKRTVTLGAVTLLAIALSAPYLYSVLHLKESEQLIPFGLSMAKSGGIFVSCALVIVLALFQVRAFLAQRTAGAVFFVYFTLALILICTVINLPGINTHDKLPFFIHFPLAVLGSWTFADRLSRPHASSRYRRNVVLVMLLLLLPVNTFAWLAYNNTPTGERLTGQDRELTEWVRKETPRDAIFFENNDRVLLLLTGPRRYYWGRETYAYHWGYPREEMARRQHVRDNLYSTGALDSVTLNALGRMESEVYVVVRDDEDQTNSMAKLNRYPSLFEVAHRMDGVAVLKVDRSACLEQAAQTPSPGAPSP